MISNRSRRQHAAILLAGIAALAGTAKIHAQATSWLGDGATNIWSDPLNWTNGIPSVTNVDLLFGSAFAGSPAGANALTASNDVVGFSGHRLTFETAVGNPAFTITGNPLTLVYGVDAPQIINSSAALQTFNLSGALTFDGGVGLFADVNAVNGDLAFSATTPLARAGTTELRFATAASRTTTVSGVISGGGGVTKTGGGTLVLGGANTFTGPLTIKAGTASIATINNASSNGTLGNNAASVTLGDAGTRGTLRYTGTGVTSNKAFTLATGGSGGLEVTTAGTTLTLSGTITGGGGLVKLGPGILSLGGANDYSGGLTISSGQVITTNVGSLGSGTTTLGDANTGSSDVSLFHQVGSGTSASTNIVVSANGTGLAQIIWNQDWAGSAGQNVTTTNDLKFTLNRAVNFRAAAGGKQIAPFVTGPGAGAGNVTVKVDGGTQVTWTAAMDAANTSVRVNDFVGNVWVTGNTTLQAQNRGYQDQTNHNNAALQNGIIPDQATVIVDAGSTWKQYHGSETVGFLSGGGTVLFGNLGTQNELRLAGSSTTLTTGGATGTATFSGTLAQADNGVFKNGSGTQELSGAGITYGSATTLNDGVLKLTKTTGFASTVTVGAANTPTLQLNSALAADSWTFAKAINGGSAAAKIEKVGPGTVVLAPAAGSTFIGDATGALTATSGSLYLNSAFTTTPAVSVSATGLFGGKATVGPVAVAAGGAVEGGQGGAGVLTMSNLTFAGAGAISGPLSLTTASLNVTGALTASGGANSITVGFTGALPTTNGTYHLLQYGTFGGNASTFKFATPVRSLSIQNNSGFIDVLVDSSLFPIFTGTAGGEWSTNVLPTKNWKLASNGTPTDFLGLDNVLFDTTSATRDIVVSQTNVNPGNITFNNTAITPYTLGGTKDITSGTLIKQGPGTLTINSTYSFAGGATLSGGTVVVAAEMALGTGARTFDGGTLSYTGGSATWSRNSIVNATGGTLEVATAGSTVIHSGTITGPGTLTKSGPGTLQLGGGTYAPNFTIAAGSLKTDSTTGAVNLNGKISGPGSLELYGNNVTTIGGTVANDFTGDTNIYGNQIFLNKPAGSNGAITGNINIRVGTWPAHGLTISANEQIADTSVLSFLQTADPFDFRLNGFTETIAGISANLTDSYKAIIENAGYQSGSNDTGINNTGKLIVNGPGSYRYTGQLRNQNSGTNAPLAFGKSGTGKQTLFGGDINYTGPTTVTGGTLALVNTTNFGSSSLTVTTPGTVELARETADWTFAKAITGTGGVKTTSDLATGGVTMSVTSDYQGPTEVVSGTLNLTGSLTASAVTVDALATLKGTGRVGGLLTIADGGTLSPGAAGGVLFADAGLTLTSGSNLLFDLTGTNQTVGVGTNDSVTITGNLKLDGTLSLNGAFGGSFTGATQGTKWRLFDYSGTLINDGIVFGTMPALGDNLSFAVDVSTDHQVNLAVVPEPGTGLALLGGLGALAGLRRRRS
jgi:fibronectin-binding autotransporter adhesin